MRYSARLAGSVTLMLVVLGCGETDATSVVTSPSRSPDAERAERDLDAEGGPSRAGDFCQSRENVPSRTILSGNRVDGLEDWFRLGDQVLEVTVLRERLGPPSIEDARGPKILHARDLLLRVERILHGSLQPGQEIWIRSMEGLWADRDGNALADSEQGCSLLMAGNRALVALQGDGTSSDITDTALVNPDSAVVLRGSEILDTPRGKHDKVIKQLERASAAEAITMLKQARDRALD